MNTLEVPSDVKIDPAERVLWVGHPSLRRYLFHWWDLVFLAFFALWLIVPAIALTQPTPARPGQSPPPVWVFLLPALFFAAFVFVPRYLVGWRDATGTTFVLTERRAVIHGRRHRADVTIAATPYVELQRTAFSGASINFAPRSPYDQFFGGGWWSGGQLTPSFRGLAVEEAERVYELILGLRGAGGGPR